MICRLRDFTASDAGSVNALALAAFAQFRDDYSDWETLVIALPMYQRMRFVFEREAPAIFGVPYGIYVKQL